MLKSLIQGVLWVGLAMAARPLLAVDDVTVQLTHQKIVADPKGGEKRVEASSAKPGEVIEYVAIYSNQGKRPVSKMEATLPIPVGTEWVAGSSAPEGAKASVDGVRFETIPLKRKVTRADGKVVEEQIPYREYRFLRWAPGTLAAGKSLTHSARVRVIAIDNAVATVRPSNKAVAAAK